MKLDKRCRCKQLRARWSLDNGNMSEEGVAMSKQWKLIDVHLWYVINRILLCLYFIYFYTIGVTKI